MTSPVVNALSAALALELVVAAVGDSLADGLALVLTVGAVGVGIAHPRLRGRTDGRSYGMSRFVVTVLIGYYDCLGTLPKNSHRPIIVTEIILEY